MSEERRLEVLRAIVQDYVATSEPVGSKALLERHQLGVSAATVRGDMAALEDEGLISAPHTSAGRIPTDAGYRLFVDRLSTVKPLSRAEKSAIQTFLAQSVDLDDVVDRSTRLLASLTNQVAVMQYPSVTSASVRHVELVPVAGNRLLVVLILSTGRVEQRVVPVPSDLSDETDLLAQLRTRVNEAVVGRRRTDAVSAIKDLAVPLAEQLPQADQGMLSQILAEVTSALQILGDERVVMAGRANLAKSATDVRALAPVLEALEQHVILLKLLGHLDGDPDNLVMVRIGAENDVADLQSTSVISTTYQTGGLGVVGPTRMDYPATMAAVRAVARYVSEILE